MANTPMKFGSFSVAKIGAQTWGSEKTQDRRRSSPNSAPGTAVALLGPPTPSFSFGGTEFGSFSVAEIGAQTWGSEKTQDRRRSSPNSAPGTAVALLGPPTPSFSFGGTEFGFFSVDEIGAQTWGSEKTQDRRRSSPNSAPGTAVALLGPPTPSFSFGGTEFGSFSVAEIGAQTWGSEKTQDRRRSSPNSAPGTAVALLGPPTPSFSFGGTEFGSFSVAEIGAQTWGSEKTQDRRRSSPNSAPGTAVALLGPPTPSFSFGGTGKSS
ncbi:nuclear pore complex protein Nup214-like [Eulemur rufifrons]|uniref:nuclear pore complex protein Nup214-like n=1 Tax=Eulemur rufifrons TaxID=859984 RepID=UPI0037435839